MRTWIFSKKDCWLTQSELNDRKPRVFVKRLPVNHPEMWTEWTETQRQEYIREYGETTLSDYIKCYKAIDYSTIEGGFWGKKQERVH